MTPADILVLSLLFIVILAIAQAAKIHDQNITNEVDLETEINHKKQMIKLLSKTKELNAPKESSMEEKSVSLFDIIKDTSFLESDINPKSTQENSVYDLLETGIRKEEKIINSLTSIEKLDFIQNELTAYSKYIQSITNPSFEKIRRYCNNLTDENKADEMQKYLAENGRMHKALIYDALEQFISQLNEKTLTLIDWGCDQGIASMLVLDYIREKQLEIIVNQVFLIDTNAKILSRAVAHVDSLKQNEIEIITLDCNNGIKELQKIKNSTTLNLIVNDSLPINWEDVDFNYLNNGCFLCLSNSKKEFVEETYDSIGNFIDIQNVSIRDGKIGKFERFEKIFVQIIVSNSGGL